MTSTHTEGTTSDGVPVLVVHNFPDYTKDSVYITGEKVNVQSADRRRDGGTTIYHTDKGTLTLPRKIGNPDRTPIWQPSHQPDVVTVTSPKTHVVICEVEGSPFAAFETKDRAEAHDVLAECEDLPAFSVQYTLIDTETDRAAFITKVKENLDLP